jgi:CheY-like chemotaxis protein
MDSERQQALAVGFDGYLTKPISLDALRKKLAALLA